MIFSRSTQKQNQNKEKKNSFYEQSNNQWQNQDKNFDLEQLRGQIVKKDVSKDALMQEKQSFEQNILTKLKEYYNHFVFLCKQDLELIEIEQRVLKKYFQIKVDSEKLKVIIVSLTNQIISENFLIYNNLLKNKFEFEANEFLQKQILFRKRLQEMIADKNQVPNSIILYLINFSRQAFLIEKEQSEKIIVQKLQYYKNLESQIQQLLKNQQNSQNQSLPDTQPNMIITQLRIHQNQNNQQDDSNNLDTQMISDTKSQYQKDKNSKQNEESIQQLDKNTISYYQGQPLSPRVLYNNSQRPSLFFKQTKNEKNSNDDLILLDSRQENQQQKQKNTIHSRQNFIFAHDQQKMDFDDNQCLLLGEEFEQKNSKQIRSQSLYNKKGMQDLSISQIEGMWDQNNSMSAQGIYQNLQNQTQNSNEKYSLSPISQTNKCFLKLPKLQQSLQLINSPIQKINDNLENDQEQQFHSTFNKRENLVPSHEQDSFIESQKDLKQFQSNLAESQLSKSINFDNKIYYQSEQLGLKANSSSQREFKNSQQHKELYFSNQNFQQSQTTSTPSISKSEYFFSIQSQLKKTDLINSKDFRRLSFTVSNRYKKKWKNQQKCNFEDYSPIDCQYHHLACQQILNSIEILNDKKIFLEKMYTNLIKTNSYISQTIKSYLQQKPNRVRQSSYTRPTLSSQNFNVNFQSNSMNESKSQIQDCSILLKGNNKGQTVQNNPQNNLVPNKPNSNFQIIQKSFSNQAIKAQANNESIQKPCQTKQNLAKAINLALVTTPKNNQKQKQVGLNCLSLVNSNDSPFTKKLNEEIQSFTNIKKFREETFLDSKAIEKQLYVTKSNSVLFKKNSDILISESQSERQTNSPNPVKCIKDKLIRIKTILERQPTVQQKQFHLQNHKIYQQSMSIEDLIEPLNFRQNLFKNLELSPKNLLKPQTNRFFEQVNMNSKNSPNQKIQFIFLQQPNNKYNQNSKETYQDQRVQQPQNMNQPTPRNLNNMVNFYSNANNNNDIINHKLQNYKNNFQNLQMSPYLVKKQKNDIFNNLEQKNLTNESLIIGRQFSENLSQKQSTKSYLDNSYGQSNNQTNNCKEDNENFKDQKINQNLRNKLQIFHKKQNQMNVK